MHHVFPDVFSSSTSNFFNAWLSETRTMWLIFWWLFDLTGAQEAMHAKLPISNDSRNRVPIERYPFK